MVPGFLQDASALRVDGVSYDYWTNSVTFNLCKVSAEQINAALTLIRQINTMHPTQLIHDEVHIPVGTQKTFLDDDMRRLMSLIDTGDRVLSHFAIDSLTMIEGLVEPPPPPKNKPYYRQFEKRRRK